LNFDVSSCSSSSNNRVDVIASADIWMAAGSTKQQGCGPTRGTNMDALHAEPDRAGRPTRNPGVMVYQADTGERLCSEARQGPMRHCYSSQGYRPSKRNPEAGVRLPRSSEGVAATLTSSPSVFSHQRSGQSQFVTLENYLNDMKRCSASLRTVPYTPSSVLQRMNDERVLLPADTQHRRARSSSRESRATEQSDQEEQYGFIRKRPVTGAWTGSSMTNDLLHHCGDSRHSTPSRVERVENPCTPNFDDIVAHMKESHKTC